MTNVVTNPATVQMLKLRFLNRESAMSGSFAWRSATANSTPATTTVASSATMTGESQAYSTPPHEVASVSAVTATTSVTVPQVSKCAFSTVRRGFGKNATAVPMATSASGTLIQNAQRQPMVSVNRPPSSGPASMGTA